MDAKVLKDILDKHLKWLKNEPDGKRADLRSADLRSADLRYADLSSADLSYANLRSADLRSADLRSADLSSANLRSADLRYANLSSADLRYADLRYADLRSADLRSANLRSADLRYANLSSADLRYANLRSADLSSADLSSAEIDKQLINKFYPLCCPEYGSFIGWKSASCYIVKLEICEDAKRSSAFGRKCRCNKAKCLAIENIDGTDSGLEGINSDYDCNFIYKVGKIITVDNFDEDRTHECAPGIHFFITRDEAVNYNK